MALIANIERHTPRATLRILQSGHEQSLLDFYTRNTAHFCQWEPQRAPNFYTREYMAEKCRQSETLFQQEQGFHWLAFIGEELVGFCNFNNLVRGVFQACYLGYGVDERYQGQGLMREVVQSGVDYMFDEVGLHRIMANYMPSNHRSAALLNFLGFEKEGFARDYLKINGRWEDHVLTARINPHQ